MGSVMNGTNVFGGSSVALGRLEELKSFSVRPKVAVGLPDDCPVLTFPLRAREYRCLGSNHGRCNFGFGHMELEDGMLMTMRLQLDGVQFYWLAEMTDPELWAAIDMWRSVQRVPFGLKIENGDTWGIAFGAVDCAIDNLTDEKYRAGPQRIVTARDWKAMAGLVTGVVQMQATTDIPDISLRHVFASALLTKQFEEVAGREPLVKKPVIVKSLHGRHILI
jgi:hypothetical protein